MMPDVSRETLDRLNIYADLLKKWNAKINLVAPSTLNDIQTRHFDDSRQLLDCAPDARSWGDLGTGGGFPGMIVAILSAELNPDRRVTMVESDSRKCAFLRSVLRETAVSAEVSAQRIEELDPLNADVVSARALAPLTRLLAHCERHLSPQGTALFPKGERWEEEVTEAQSEWKFDLQAITSVTNPSSKILVVRNIARV